MKDHKSKMEYVGNGDIRIHHQQDITQLLEENKQLREKDQYGKDMKLAARIPMNLIFQWEQEGIKMDLVGIDPDMTARFWKKLQERENKAFRVWQGRMV